MKTFKLLYTVITFIVFIAGTVFAQNEPIRNDFDLIESYITGDVNRDNKLNFSDLLDILSFYLNDDELTEEQLHFGLVYAADNGN